MLKPYHLFSIILLLSYFSVNAQVRKAYMTADDVQTLDSTKAASYVLIQKMADSGWTTYKYDMHDSIMIKGSFKDENLTIPHGKFIYYKIIEPVRAIVIKYNYVKHNMDTLKWYPKNYVSSAGYYVNGKREGVWVDNDLRYNIHTVLNYQANKLNGAFQEYGTEDGILRREGQFYNDRQVGKWVSFTDEGDTLSVVNFENGVKKDGKFYEEKHKRTEPKPIYDILQYLNLELANTQFNNTWTFYTLYTFTVTKDGKLVNPQVKTPSDLEIDKAVIDKLLVCPLWNPGTHDGKPIDQHISICLEITKRKKRPIEISYPLHSDYTKF